jgi:probable rRNA maturation factor
MSAGLALPPSPLGDAAWGTIDLVAESALWDDEPTAEAVVRRAITVAALAAASGGGGEVSVVLTDDAAIRALNRTWRNIDKPTNVLSFPVQPAPAAGRPLPPPAGEESAAQSATMGDRLLGDIVIAYETVAREADQEGKRFSDHLAHLAVHGFLHLLGYDHDSDSAAEEMERLESRILAQLAVPDPYLAR